jgi:aspartate--ammonia ligase
MLQDGEFPIGEGLVVDMHAIRKDEQESHIHSLLVHQFDWEKRISREQRTTEFLQKTV